MHLDATNSKASNKRNIMFPGGIEPIIPSLFACYMECPVIIEENIAMPFP
jgi:hypothetical protein